MNLLETLESAVAQDPGLMSLNIVRKALRGLREGESHLTVVEWLSQDLDKFGPKSREFHDYLMNAHKCVDAYRRIQFQNQLANGDRGVQAVRHMLMSLERFDLEDAKSIFRNGGDKIRQYGRLYKTIQSTAIGCREHGIGYYCPHCYKV
jgi:hypothetical protein